MQPVDVVDGDFDAVELFFGAIGVDAESLGRLGVAGAVGSVGDELAQGLELTFDPAEVAGMSG